MMWKAGVDLHVQTFSLNHIDARIMNNSPTPWRITGFYGRPEAHQKHESWELLRHLHSRDSMLCCVWVTTTRYCHQRKSKVASHDHPSKWRISAKHYYIVG